MNVGAGYRNIYGTAANLSGDPLRKTVGLDLNVPVGEAERGLSVNARFGYDAGTQTPSGFIGFSKKNLSKDRETARAQLGLDDSNRNKYEYGLTLNQPNRFAGEALGIPLGQVQVPPPPPPGFSGGYQGY